MQHEHYEPRGTFIPCRYDADIEEYQIQGRNYIHGHLADRAAYPCRSLQQGWSSCCSGDPVFPGQLDHTEDREVKAEKDLHIAKIKWVKSDKALRVSLLLLQREDLTELKNDCGGASKVVVREEDRIAEGQHRAGEVE